MGRRRCVCIGGEKGVCLSFPQGFGKFFKDSAVWAKFPAGAGFLFIFPFNTRRESLFFFIFFLFFFFTCLQTDLSLSHTHTHTHTHTHFRKKKSPRKKVLGMIQVTGTYYFLNE